MQVIENNFKIMENGVLSLTYHHGHPKDIARMIEQLKSACAPEYIHTTNVFVRALCECDELWAALKDLVHKTNKIKNLLLYGYCTAKESYHNVNAVIKILCEFKNVTNLELVLSNMMHNVDEINKLRKYFNNQTTIKKLQLRSDYHTISSFMNSNEFWGSIETIDLTIVRLDHVIGLIPISMTHKIKKIYFNNCRPCLDHMLEFNIFLERFLALNSTIQELDLSNVSLNTDTIRIISTFIKTSNNLITLSVRCCDINDEQIDVLVRSLEMSNIERLNIDDNCIGYEGALGIAAMLNKNKSLKVVSIRGNFVAYEGIIEIVKVLATNPTVREFYCTDTDSIVTGETMESIRQTFEKILLDNDILVCFYARLKLELELGDTVCVELENTTDKNKRVLSANSWRANSWRANG